MLRPSVAIAQTAIRASQFTPFRGRGGNYGAAPDQLDQDDPAERFRQGIAEHDRATDFYKMFPECPVAFAGKTVLDFGSGYGGKTIEYGRHADFVAGASHSPT